MKCGLQGDGRTSKREFGTQLLRCNSNRNQPDISKLHDAMVNNV